MQGLYLVTDRELCAEKGLAQVVSQAVQGGVGAVQLREKQLSTSEFIAAAQTLKRLLADSQIPLIINDRVDIALAVEADGVHLGQSDMPYPLARKLLGGDAIIGLSVNCLSQLEEAEKWEVSYLGLSPIFDTPTKPDTTPAWGIAGLKEARRISRHPLVAIGGLNKTNVQMVLAAGADSIAVVSAICAAESPLVAAGELSAEIELFNCGR